MKLVLTCKAPHFKFLINFNEKYWFKLIFRDVYDSTPKQIKMSTPLATCKVPWLTQEIGTKPGHLVNVKFLINFNEKYNFSLILMRNTYKREIGEKKVHFSFLILPC